MNHLLHSSCLVKHLLGHLLANQPSGSIMRIILHESDTDLGWHLLQAVGNSDILTLQILLIAIFVQASESFWLQGTLGRQILQSLRQSIEL